jgi:hypothetical protein
MNYNFAKGLVDSNFDNTFVGSLQLKNNIQVDS